MNQKVERSTRKTKFDTMKSVGKEQAYKID
jgi:hypothetical protein